MSDAPSDADGDDAASGTAPSITLPDEALDALLSAVESLDPGDDLELGAGGPRLSVGDDGFVFASDDGRRDGLDEDGLREVASEHAAAVADWYFLDSVAGDHPPRRAFLRWLEYADETEAGERYAALADGVVREWGQLAITVARDDRGERTYEVRNADEADAPVDDLERYDDPLDARRLVKFDDDGRYRPLKTAPTLPTGWVFADLGPREAYEAVETIYPATIENWHREREGELDVSHWRETMERQTGIYGVIQTWDRDEGHEHVDWVAEACCADSQCLKRREWEYDEETDLDVDGGDGVFPCREPCSVVVSAARQWTKLEGEQSHTYEIELTPSEVEQIEAIVDAVAEGRTDDIREADVYEGANRYRARFLRAKLFGDGDPFTPVDAPAEDE